MSKQPNQFDTLVGNFIREFSKVENFHLMREDPVGKVAFDVIVFRVSDITTYKTLVCQGFVPSANRLIVKAKDDVRKSQYGKGVKIADEQYRETLHETIRLSYVGLFHKIEAFAKDVATMTDLILQESAGSDFSIKQHVKTHFGINDITKCWQSFHDFHTVNWVANCVKHYDGYPLKEMVPRKYAYLKKEERMRLTKDDFESDCQAVIDFYPKFLEIVMRMGQHRVISKQFDKLPVPEVEELLRKVEVQFGEILRLYRPSIQEGSAT